MPEQKKKKDKKKKKNKGSEARREREEEVDSDEELNLPAVAHDLENLPAHIAQDAADEMAGLENMEGRDLIIPRLVLMQALSPPVVEGDAVPGEFYESVERARVIGRDEQTRFVPSFMYKEFIAWNDRNSKELWSGRSLDPNGTLALAAQRGDKRHNKEGKEVFVVTEHINFIALIPEFGLDKPFSISCAKSNWKHGKKLMNLARFRRQPLFAGSYNLATQLESNTDGDKFFAYEFSNAGWAEPEEYEAAKALYEVMKVSFQAGRLKTDEGMQEADIGADVELAKDM